MNKRICIIELIPKSYNLNYALNVGVKLLKKSIEMNTDWRVDTFNYSEDIDISKYDIIGFNIFYINQVYNLVPFLKKHNIHPVREMRDESPLLIAGGQGIYNYKIINKIVDIIHLGEGEENLVELLRAYEDRNLDKLLERDGIYYCKYDNNVEFVHLNRVESSEMYTKGIKSVIELNRGCKYNCKFCQYSYTFGDYREKDINLVEEQIFNVRSMGANRVNFMSCNFTGYSKIESLLDICKENNIKVRNTDVRINEYSRIADKLRDLNLVRFKTGIESFDESVRMKCNKGITDDELFNFIEESVKNEVIMIHFYLIYGLPIKEDFNKWFESIEKIEKMTQGLDRNIKVDYSITNFQPSKYTPYENTDLVDFDEKERFLKEYFEVLKRVGKIPQKAKFIDSMIGAFRPGKKEVSYKIMMYLRQGGEEVNRVLINMDSGVRLRVDRLFLKKLLKAGADIELREKTLQEVYF